MAKNQFKRTKKVFVTLLLAIVLLCSVTVLMAAAINSALNEAVHPIVNIKNK